MFGEKSMRNILIVKSLIMFLSITGICQEKRADLDTEKKTIKSEVVCPKNTDNLYGRQQTLEQIAELLNDSIPEFKTKWDKGFFVRNEMPWRFNIYDLTDISNKTSVRDDFCINFINRHVYHVFPDNYSYSFSHIIILEDGKLKIFKSINCKGRADSLDDVLNYLKQNLTDNNKDEIMDRVRDYRTYGSYHRVDPMASLQCKEIKN